jgi:hypothetical protein
MRRRACIGLETLETRIVPYALSGDAWPNPNLITLSFEPDGTELGGNSSNLFSTFNAHPGWTTSTWENQILKAAQAWAAQTNINFAVIPDNGAPMGAGRFQQGSYYIGDIRIGGFNMGSSPLAETFMPPSDNNFSVAGDIQFNTGVPFNIGKTYDLYTVAMHEIGHALGLYHSSDANAIMYGTYNGVKSGPNSDDVAGIQAIYSNGQPRSPDQYGGTNTSFSTAANINGLIDPTSLTAVVNGLDLYTNPFGEYLTFNNPSGASSTLTITVQSSGLSLLSPSLTVFNCLQQQVAYVSGQGQYGTTISVTLQNIHAGKQIYVEVAGADSTAFATGNYAMTFQWGSTPPPPVPSAIVQVLNGNPLQSAGGEPDNPDGGRHGSSSQSVPMTEVATAPVVNTVLAARPTVQTLASTPVLATSFLPATVTGVQFVGSGTTEEFGTTALDSGSQDEAAPVMQDQSATGATGYKQRQPDQDAVQGSVSWPETTATCFASASKESRNTETAASLACVRQDELRASGFDHAAALASMVLVLGGYWGKSPDDAGPAQQRRNKRALSF